MIYLFFTCLLARSLLWFILPFLLHSFFFFFFLIDDKDASFSILYFKKQLQQEFYFVFKEWVFYLVCCPLTLSPIYLFTSSSVGRMNDWMNNSLLVMKAWFWWSIFWTFIHEIGRFKIVNLFDDFKLIFSINKQTNKCICFCASFCYSFQRGQIKWR